MMEVEIPLLGVLVVKDHAQQVQKKMSTVSQHTQTGTFILSGIITV